MALEDNLEDKFEDKFGFGIAEGKITRSRLSLPSSIKQALNHGLKLQLAVMQKTLFLGDSSFRKELAPFSCSLYCSPQTSFIRYQQFLDFLELIPFQNKEYTLHKSRYYWSCFYLVGYEKNDFPTEMNLLYQGMIDKPRRLKRTERRLNNKFKKYGFCQKDSEILFLRYGNFFELWASDTLRKYYTLSELYPQKISRG